MNGTIFDEIKKNDLSKKRDRLKFFAAIFFTNALVALSSWSLFTDSPSATPPKVQQKLFHPHHKTIIAPLTVMVETGAKGVETPVTLMNKNKKILVPKAYLHEEVPPTNGQEMGSTRFRIEIPEEAFLKVSEDLLDPMVAIPEIQSNRPVKAVQKRISKYEMVF